MEPKVIDEENEMTPLTPDPDNPGAHHMSNDSDDRTAKQHTEEGTQDLKQEAGDRMRDEAETGQHKAAEEANALSEAIDAAASNLDEHDREGLARYAREMSNNLASAAGRLEERSVDELAKDAKHLARNNPAMFVLGSIAVGFGLSRFFKASGEGEHQTHQSPDRATEPAQENHAWPAAPFERREGDRIDTKATSTEPTNGHGRDML